MRKGGNSISLSPHYVPLVRIFMSAFPFSPGGWHLSNDYCSEPLEKLYWTNRIKQNHLCPQAASIPEGNITVLRDTGKERGCWTSWRGARSPHRKDYKCEKSEKLLMWIFDFAGGATGTSSRRNGRQKGQCGVSQGGKHRSHVSGGLWGFKWGATGGSGASCDLQGCPGFYLFHWFNFQYTISSLICV